MNYNKSNNAFIKVSITNRNGIMTKVVNVCIILTITMVKQCPYTITNENVNITTKVIDVVVISPIRMVI